MEGTGTAAGAPEPAPPPEPPADALSMVTLAQEAELAELRRQVAVRSAVTRRLQLENQKLRSELRRARPQEAVVQRLHCESVESKMGGGNAGAPSGGAGADARHGAERHSLATPRWITEAEGGEGGAPPEDTEEAADESHASGPPQSLTADASFEMLETVAEVELSEEKKALQRKLRALEQELLERSQGRGQPESSSPAVPPARRPQPAEPRQRRRLQHMDAILACLHEELCRRSGGDGPGPRAPDEHARRVWVDPVAGGNHVSTPRASARDLGESAPPRTGSPAPGPACAAEEKAAASEKAFSIATPSPQSKCTTGTLSSRASVARARQLDRNIKALSRRFLLLRDMK